MAIIWQTTPRNGHLVVRRASNPPEGGASAIFRIVEEHEIRQRVVAVGKKCLDLRFRCKNSTMTRQLGRLAFFRSRIACTQPVHHNFQLLYGQQEQYGTSHRATYFRRCARASLGTYRILDSIATLEIVSQLRPRSGTHELLQLHHRWKIATAAQV